MEKCVRMDQRSSQVGSSEIECEEGSAYGDGQLRIEHENVLHSESHRYVARWWMKKEAERVRHETGHLPLLRAIGDTSDEGRARTRCSACLRLTRTRFSVHHGHGVVVLAEPKTKIVDELLCDAEEAVIVELELALDVVEDGPACLSLLGVSEGGDGRHGWRRR